MYLTEDFRYNGEEDFDWEAFFAPHKAHDMFKQMDPVRMTARMRNHLQEDNFKLTFVLSKMMRQLLKGIKINNPGILELGAATGFLTRWLLNRYKGSGVLVDSSEASFKAYENMVDDLKQWITYLKEDIFTLQLNRTFDLVCSFGLIEHFKDKRRVIDAHKRFVSDEGYIIVLVPEDTPLSRAFLEIHPELNLGYRELLTEKEFKVILKDCGLDIIKTETSHGYCYDFVGALCRG
jgi:2-polyprenyl-3-methyl-5-hydroxy-6-metoxy-1,4-benzoquinol methylase